VLLTCPAWVWLVSAFGIWIAGFALGHAIGRKGWRRDELEPRLQSWAELKEQGNRWLKLR
jgi:hypothetical protein